MPHHHTLLPSWSFSPHLSFHYHAKCSMLWLCDEVESHVIAESNHMSTVHLPKLKPPPFGTIKTSPGSPGALSHIISIQQSLLALSAEIFTFFGTLLDGFNKAAQKTGDLKTHSGWVTSISFKKSRNKLNAKHLSSPSIKTYFQFHLYICIILYPSSASSILLLSDHPLPHFIAGKNCSSNLAFACFISSPPRFMILRRLFR